MTSLLEEILKRQKLITKRHGKKAYNNPRYELKNLTGKRVVVTGKAVIKRYDNLKKNVYFVLSDVTVNGNIKIDHLFLFINTNDEKSLKQLKRAHYSKKPLRLEGVVTSYRRKDGSTSRSLKGVKNLKCLK